MTVLARSNSLTLARVAAAEATAIDWCLDFSYTRSPRQRKEQEIPMDIAAQLECRRDVLTFEEFSPAWNGLQGSWP